MSQYAQIQRFDRKNDYNYLKAHRNVPHGCAINANNYLKMNMHQLMSSDSDTYTVPCRGECLTVIFLWRKIAISELIMSNAVLKILLVFSSQSSKAFARAVPASWRDVLILLPLQQDPHSYCQMLSELGVHVDQCPNTSAEEDQLTSEYVSFMQTLKKSHCVNGGDYSWTKVNTYNQIHSLCFFQQQYSCLHFRT